MNNNSGGNYPTAGTDISCIRPDCAAVRRQHASLIETANDLEGDLAIWRNVALMANARWEKAESALVRIKKTSLDASTRLLVNAAIRGDE